jgi:hypothetical protein
MKVGSCTHRHLVCKPRRYIHDSKGLFSRCIHQEDVADAVPYWMHQKQQVMLGRRNLHVFPVHEREKMKQITFASKDYVKEHLHQFWTEDVRPLSGQRVDIITISGTCVNHRPSLDRPRTDGRVDKLEDPVYFQISKIYTFPYLKFQPFCNRKLK